MPDVLPDEKLLSLTNSALKSTSTLFLLPSDTKVDFDDILTISFPLLKQGFIDMDNITLGENDKVVLKLNINYKWINADLAPRYELSIYKNITNLIYTVLRCYYWDEQPARKISSLIYRKMIQYIFNYQNTLRIHTMKYYC